MNNDNEWGNIELPGLSDDILMHPSINTIMNNKVRANDPAWKQEHASQLKRMNTDPTILATRRKSNEVTWVGVTSPMGVFDKVSSFEKATGMAFYDKKRLLPHLYYITNKGPGKVKTEKVYYAPTGQHSTMLYHYTRGVETEHYQTLTFKPQIAWFKKMMKLYPTDYYIVVEAKRDWLIETGVASKAGRINKLKREA